MWFKSFAVLNLPFLILVAVLAGSAHTHASPVVIDFESVPSGKLASYTESGVTFDAVPASGIVTIDFSPTPDGSNGLLAEDESLNLLPIRADIASGAISVSVDLGDFNVDADDLFLEAYSSSDVLVGSDSTSIPGTFVGMETLSVVTPGIAYAIFGGVSARGFSSVFVDNFTFEIPEPSTLALAAIGFVGLAGFGWQRKRWSASRRAAGWRTTRVNCQ